MLFRNFAAKQTTLIMTYIKKYLIALSLLTALWSCYDNEDNNVPEEPEETIARRTVLVYMAAENSLNSLSESDLTEMKTGSESLAEDQNLIVYVDEASLNRTPFLARVKNGALVDTLYMEESLTADPAVLEKVLRTAKAKYPARSYGLVLWGHASGWLVSNDSVAYAPSRAYGGDTGTNSSSGSGKYWMNIPSMAKAIANGMGSDKMRFVFGDCCNFLCIEVAYELRNVTDYVIGSPAEIPDPGAPYELVVPQLFLETDNFYEQVIDNYYYNIISEFKEAPYYFYNLRYGDLAGYSVPLAAVKTSELEDFAYATAQILATLTDKLTYPSTVDLTKATYYAMYRNYRYSYDINSVLKDNAYQTDYSSWLTAYNRAVPYHLYSQKWLTGYLALANVMESFDTEGKDCGVVSMFFPSTDYSNTNPNWNTAIQHFQWNDVIRWQQYGW